MRFVFNTTALAHVVRAAHSPSKTSNKVARRTLNDLAKVFGFDSKTPSAIGAYDRLSAPGTLLNVSHTGAISVSSLGWLTDGVLYERQSHCSVIYGPRITSDTLVTGHALSGWEAYATVSLSSDDLTRCLAPWMSREFAQVEIPIGGSAPRYEFSSYVTFAPQFFELVDQVAKRLGLATRPAAQAGA